MGNRIVLTTYGSLGDLHMAIAKQCCVRPWRCRRLAQIALELKDRGHYPVITTYVVYRSKVEVDGKVV